MAGDLVTELDVVTTGETGTATVGETLRVSANEPVEISIRFRDPKVPNGSGNDPTVNRLDLILGDVRGPATDLNTDTNETTRVVERFSESGWTRDGEMVTVRTILRTVDRDVYIRVRGTSGHDAEPVMDTVGEDPWADLWFYSNPVFIDVR